MKICIASLKFSPGHISHIIAYKKSFESLGYSVYLLLHHNYKSIIESNIINEKINWFDNKIDFGFDFNIFPLVNPSEKNYIIAKKIRKINKNTKIIYLFHEPWKGVKNTYKEGIKKFLKAIIAHFFSIKLLKYTDLVSVVTHKMEKDYEELIGNKVFFLPNGFDGDISIKNKLNIKKKNKLNIAYTGSFHPIFVELTPFLKALKKVIISQKNVDINFIYAGMNARWVENEFYKLQINNILTNYGFVSREKSLEIQKNADVLLLIAYTGDNEKAGASSRTGKVYEYLASGKPIIAIAPLNWEMKEEIEADGVSKVFHKSQTNDMANYLVKLSKKERI